MKKILIKLIKIYQSIPLRSHNYCKFSPRCSDYTIDAITEYGAILGSWMGLKRILRCNPFNKGGYDPIIKRSEKK